MRSLVLRSANGTVLAGVVRDRRSFVTPGTVSVADFDDTSITVNYSGARDGVGPYTHTLQRRGPTGGWAEVGPITPGTPVTDTDLSENTEYRYRVRSEDSLGARGVSGERHVQTLGNTIFHQETGFAFGEPVTPMFWANGDPAVVVGAEGLEITGTTPEIIDDNGDLFHGVEVNPSNPSGAHGLGTMDGFDPDFVQSFPFTAMPGDSIVKAINRWNNPIGDPPLVYGNRPTRPDLDNLTVLTCIEEAPAGGTAAYFRPPSVGTNKHLRPVSDIDLARLPVIEPPPGVSLSNIDALVRNWERWQVMYRVDGNRGRAFRPRTHMNDYAAAINTTLMTTLARIFMSDLNDDDRMRLVIPLAQAGLDSFNAYNEIGTRTRAWGGQGLGSKVMQVFAAVMLDNAAMKAQIAEWVEASVKMSGGSGEYHEDGCIWWAENAKLLTWGQDNNLPVYDQRAAGGSGSRDVIDPYDWIDGGDVPNASYHIIVNPSLMNTAMIMHLWPAFRETWHNDDILEYANRWVHFGCWTLPDPMEAGGTGEQDGIGRFPTRHGIGANSGNGTYDSSLMKAVRVAMFPGRACFMPDIRIEGGTVTIEAFRRLTPDGYPNYWDVYDADENNPWKDGVWPYLPAATVRYTTDGSEPTESSTVYSDPFAVGEAEVIKAKAFHAGFNASQSRVVEVV